MPVVWHYNRWLDRCVSEGEKKKIDQMLIEKLQKCICSIQLELLKRFVHEFAGSIQYRPIATF